MKYTIHNFPYRWFGYWKETHKNSIDVPSIFDFVDKEVNQTYNKAGLRRYLTEAHLVARSLGSVTYCVFTGKKKIDYSTVRTDGKWYWLEDIADYIDEFDIVIPVAFYKEIEKRNFVPPPVKNVNRRYMKEPWHKDETYLKYFVDEFLHYIGKFMRWLFQWPLRWLFGPK